MVSVKKTCRVCGKEYEPCRTASRNPNVFHWQEVACSPECGAEYLRRIMASRNPAPSASKSSKAKHRTVPVAEAENLPQVGEGNQVHPETTEIPIKNE